MTSPSHGHDRLSALATAIEHIEGVTIYGRVIGVRGLLKPHPIERLVRDLSLYLRQPVPDAALTNAGQFVLESPSASPDLWSPHP